MSQQNTFGTLATAGGGSTHAGNTYNTGGGAITFATSGIDSDIDAPCLRAWRLTDPRDDRTRVLASKDPLLAGSCDWILDDAAFAQWWKDDESRILWIHGDPGKGKTMLMMALTEEIARRVGATPDQKAATAFFFCQNTVPELSNAAAVVRGLTFLLAAEQPALRRHLARKYAEAGERLFEGLNVLPSLWTTLADMAQDASVSRLYLLVDALDECEQDLLHTFLDLATSPAASCKIKWVFTSRNIQSIQEQLLHADFSHHTSLEVNSSRVSEAVVSFIRFKVDRLAAQKRYSTEIQQEVRRDMEARADGTFLWVALVCKELERVTARKTLKTMHEVPAGLPQLYQRMLEQIAAYNDEEDSKFCAALLRTITIAQRPLDQAEIGHLAGLPPDVINDLQAIEELVGSCGSFLTMREGIVSFVHQSAKDFFTTGHGCSIFLCGQPQVHEELARRLLGSMSRSLTTSICGVRWPGTQVHEAVGQVVSQRLPSHMQYACCHWADHVKAGSVTLEDGGVVHAFLKARLLVLFEALSWLGRVSDGIGAMRQLVDMTEIGRNLQELLRDAIRFVRYSRTAVEQAPLQIYSSALVFAPKKSIIRQLFSQAIPLWMRQLPQVEQDWSACLQTLEGHSYWVTSVVFSSDGQTVASGSHDTTVKLWDASTGALRSTLEGHSSVVRSVVFSPDGQTVASGSDDTTVKLWNASTGAVRSTLEGHSYWVRSVVFSPDGQTVASGSDDKTVKLWDASTGALRNTLKGHSDVVTSVVFSSDGQTVASGSHDETVKLWDASTGALRSTLEGHSSVVTSVVFSPDGQTVASGSHDETVKLWDAWTGQFLDTITAGDYITQISFSEDGSFLQTNRGAFISSALSKSMPNMVTLSAEIVVSVSWITWKGRNLLWLPPEYRTDLVAVYKSSTVFGRTSGYVTFIGFDTSAIPKPR